MGFYKDKLILAPMVRANILPFRLCCLDYGADIVFGPEIIDFSIISTERIEINDQHKRVQFKNKDGEIVFQTIEREKKNLIFQVGTSCPERAVQALKKVEQDISGFDVNMGCPKHFSIQGGMGAALLENQDKATKILSRLAECSSVPISAKIRLLPGTIENTFQFIDKIISTGISAVFIHGRTRDQKSSEQYNRQFLYSICLRYCNKISIIINGFSDEIEKYEDIITIKNSLQPSSIMIARAAKVDPSIFRPTGLIPKDETTKKILNYSLEFNVEFSSFKYVLSSLNSNENNFPTLNNFTSYYEICKFFGLPPSSLFNEEHEIILGQDIYQIYLSHHQIQQLKNCRGFYKQKLNEKFKNDKRLIKFETKQIESKFRSTIYFGNISYTTNEAFSNKRTAENACAYIALNRLTKRQEKN